MKYAVIHGVVINQPGRRFIHGDFVRDGDLPAELIAQLLKSGSIVKDEPDQARPIGEVLRERGHRK